MNNFYKMLTISTLGLLSTASQKNHSNSIENLLVKYDNARQTRTITNKAFLNQTIKGQKFKNDKISSEKPKIQIQMLDYKQAIKIGDKYFDKLHLKRENYNLVKFENLLLFGGGNKNFKSSMWRIIYKVKRIGVKDEYFLKGGEVIFHVDIKTKTVKLIGFGE
ncbi:hypothetical protein [Aquimarina litoralis]